MSSRTKVLLLVITISGIAFSLYSGCVNTLINTVSKFLSRGQLVWTAPVKGPCGSNPTLGLSTNALYVGGDKLQAFTYEGKLIWSYTTGYSVGSPAVGKDGTIYFISINKLYALAPNGIKKFEVPVAGELEFAPAIGDDGTIYVAGCTDYQRLCAEKEHDTRWIRPELPQGGQRTSLFAFDSRGRQKWAHEVPGTLNSRPVVSRNGAIYITFGQGLSDFEMKGSQLQVVSDSGAVQRQLDCGDYVEKPVIAKDGSLFIEGWKFGADGSLQNRQKRPSAIADDGTMYYISTGVPDNGKVFAEVNGKEKWSTSINEYPLFDSIALGSDGTIYFTTSDSGEFDPNHVGQHSYLFALSPNGVEKWRFEIHNGLLGQNISVGKDGTVYYLQIGGNQDYLVAVRGR